MRNRLLAISVTAVGLAASGCGGSTTNRMCNTRCQANLDDCNQVRLVHETVKSQDGMKPTEKYEQLVVVICPRPAPSAEYVLKRAETKSWPSWDKFDLGEIEIRTDAGRQHIWFVDRKSGKVVGSVDRAANKTTGPDDVPPAWATTDGGSVLK